MQEITNYYRNIYSAFFYCIQFIVLLILPSFLHMIFDLPHSTAFFISLIVFFLTLCICYSKELYLNKNFLITYTIISAIFFHGIISSFFIENFAYSRFLFSIIYLCFIVLVAYKFQTEHYRLNDIAISWVISTFFYFLLIIGFLSSYGLNISGAAGKPVFYFDEPSKFSLIIIPFFIYRLLKSSNFERLLIATLIFKLAIILPSMTLLIVSIVAPTLFLMPRKFLIIYLVYFLILLAEPTNNFYIYIKSRVPFYQITQTQSISMNAIEIQEQKFIQPSEDLYILPLPISTCIPIGAVRPPPVWHIGVSTQSRDVYYSGWLRGFYNFKSTYGMGLGFQQLGFRGCIDKFLIEYWPLNLKDGGSVGAKILNEFGIFGVFFFCFYMIVLKRKISKVRSLDSYTNTALFLDIIYISYFINLFVRGAGYFDASGFLFLVSIFSLFHSTKFNVNAHEKI